MTRLSVPGAVAERVTPPSGELDDHLRAVDVAAADWPVGLPCPSGPAGRARPGIPAGGPAAGPDAPALRSRGCRLLGDQAGRGERRTLTHDTSDASVGGLLLGPDPTRRPARRLERVPHVRRASRRGAVDDVVVAAFASPAPLLRRGGHSQGWDAGADAIGAFFARLMVAVDFKPGFEPASATADPLTRYAAFVRDAAGREPTSSEVRTGDDLLPAPPTSRSARLRTTSGPTGRRRAPCWSQQDGVTSGP